MIKVKDIKELKGDKNKRIGYSTFEKDYVMRNGEELINYCKGVYKEGEGFNLCKTNEKKTTFNQLLEVISKNNLDDEEELIIWSDECDILYFNEIIEIDNMILFI